MDHLRDIQEAVPNGILYVAAPFCFIAVILASVRAYTTINYYRTLQQFTRDPRGASQKTVASPQIPYTLPFLGNSLEFLSPKPGNFWDKLFQWHPRSTGVLTLVLGGRPTHILYSPVAVQAMFKAKSPSRDVFEAELFQKVFELPSQQIHNAMAASTRSTK